VGERSHLRNISESIPTQISSDGTQALTCCGVRRLWMPPDGSAVEADTVKQWWEDLGTPAQPEGFAASIQLQAWLVAEKEFSNPQDQLPLTQ